MYLKHWKLKHFPFDNVGDPAYFFEPDGVKSMVVDLNDAVTRRRGAILLTGEIGCGKTTLIEHFLLGLDEKKYDIALITYPCLEPLEMLREINLQLGLDADGNHRNDLLHTLQQHLANNAAIGRDTLICIDEAQSVPSITTFEELRLLLNFKLPDRFLLTLMFVGQPELTKKINKLPQLKQRIALHLHLGPLSEQDTTRYMLHRLDAAGSKRCILTRQAVDSVFRHTRGIPRRINHLADRCLLLGMRNGVSLLDSRLVKETMKRYTC
ncbi:MAG: AAA family ATPase [Mariprofundaceae bacterium]